MKWGNGMACLLEDDGQCARENEVAGKKTKSSTHKKQQLGTQHCK